MTRSAQIPADADYRMRVEELSLARSPTIAPPAFTPIAVVATVGTTSTTSVDPVEAIADICGARAALAARRRRVRRRGGHAARRTRRSCRGADRADSLVVNPHKWLFTPFDLSAFYCRRMDVLRDAFSLTPEYLRTPEAGAVKNLMDTGVQLGRRFRALKLWMILRYFGADGLRSRLAEHMRLAHVFARWVEDATRLRDAAPVPFSVVCFRANPGRAPRGRDGADTDPELNALNERIMEQVNRSGEVFLSHTKLGDRLALRLAVGNIRTEERHVRRAWELLQAALGELL